MKLLAEGCESEIFDLGDGLRSALFPTFPSRFDRPEGAARVASACERRLPDANVHPPERRTIRRLAATVAP